MSVVADSPQVQRSLSWAPLGALSQFVAESRPVVQAVFLIRFAATSELLLHPLTRSLIVGLGWVLVTGAIYVMNGLSDLAGDRANGSERPLASGRLCARTAAVLCGLTGALGVGLCLLISLACGVLAGLMAVAGVAYSLGPKLKAHAVGAALTIGIGAGLTYLAGWAARGAIDLNRVGLGLALSCWVAAACSSKDFSDVHGDRLMGRRTLPVVLGARVAATVVSGLSALAVLLVLLTGRELDLLVVGALGLGTLVLVASSRGIDVAQGRKVARRPYRVYMATQYATNGLMLVVGA